MAAAGVRTRSKKAMNYARLNAVGTTEEPLEEGQLADSPLRLNPSDDEFGTETIADSVPASLMPSHDSSLDYEDDIMQSRGDTASIITVHTSENLDPEAEEPDHDQHVIDGDEDLGQDEVWQKREAMLAANREKRERTRKRLLRMRQLAQEKLQEEKERAENAKMEKEIRELNHKRLVSFAPGSKMRANLLLKV